MPDYGLGIAVGLHVILFPQSGGAYHLWGDSGFEDDPMMKDLPIVSSLEIDISDGGAAEINISLDMTYEQGIAFLNSELGLPYCNVEAWIDYPELGLSTARYYGAVQKPNITISPDGVQITLPVKGSERSMMLRQVRSKWSEKYAKDVIEEIAKKYGKEVVYGEKAVWDMAVVPVQIDQQFFSDWRMIQELVRMHQCEMYFGTNPETEKPALFIKSISEIRATDPVKRFVMRGTVDPTVQIYPLLSFDSQTEWFFMAASSKGLISLDVDPNDKQISEETVDGTTTATPSSSPKVLDGPTREGKASPVGQKEPAMDGENEVGQNISIPASDKNRKLKMEGHYEQGAKRAGIAAACTTVGVPDLVPHECVQLVVTHGGPNSVIDGNYCISSVKHTANSSGWDMSFNCYKRGYPVSLEAANDAPGQVADREAEATPQGKDIKAEMVEVG